MTEQGWELPDSDTLLLPPVTYDPPIDVRVWQLARALGVKSKHVLPSLKYLGYEAVSGSSKITMQPIEIEAFLAYYRQKKV